MGYAVDQTCEELSTYGDEVSNELTYETLTFSEIKRLLLQKSQTLEFAKRQVYLLLELVQNIKEEQKLLLVSYGGIIEIPLLYMFMNEDHRKWGNLISYCEGYRIKFEGKAILSYEILRV